MTQKECEKQLLDVMEQAWKLFKLYNPDGTQLDMFASKDGHCVLGIIGPAEQAKFIIDGYRSPSGNYRFGKEATI